MRVKFCSSSDLPFVLVCLLHCYTVWNWVRSVFWVYLLHFLSSLQWLANYALTCNRVVCGLIRHQLNVCLCYVFGLQGGLEFARSSVRGYWTHVRYCRNTATSRIRLRTVAVLPMQFRKRRELRLKQKAVVMLLATNELATTRGRNDTGLSQAVMTSQNVLCRLFLSICPTDESY